MRVRCYRKLSNYGERQEQIPDVRISSEETQKLTAKLFTLEPQMRPVCHMLQQSDQNGTNWVSSTLILLQNWSSDRIWMIGSVP